MGSVVVPAAYCVNLAAGISKFDEAAPEAFRKLAKIVSGKLPKKRDDYAKLKFDNAVAALLNLAKEKAQFCPADLPSPIGLVLQHLPLRHDEPESKKVNASLVSMVLAQNPILLGANNANIGKVLSILAEAHGDDEIIEKTTTEQIAQIFKTISKEVIQSNAAGFTEKQRSKIQLILQ